MKLLNVMSLFLILNLIEQIFNNSFSKKSKINKNLRKLPENKYFITRIYYSNKDNYYIKLFLGEEHTSQTFILDTTFSLISSPCNLCDTCNKKFLPFYKINNEEDIIKCSSPQCSLFTNINYCEEENCYLKEDNKINSNKNIEGYLINSKLLINNINLNIGNNETLLFSIPIVCTIKEGSYYRNKDANGIIGLNNDKNTIIDNMFNLNIISNNMFSICLSKKGGYLIFGENEKSSYYSNINYINILPLSQNNNLYKLEINKFEIEQDKIIIESISYIDSTNNYSFFPKNIYDFIIQVLRKENITYYFNYDEQYGYCKILKEENEKKELYRFFPNITISFKNYKFEWEPNNYIIEFEVEVNFIKICLGFKELSDNNDEIMFGTNFMIGNKIIFDKNNQKLAFVKSDCDKFISSHENTENKNELNNGNNSLTEIFKQEENIKNDSIINETSLKSIIINDNKTYEDIKSEIYNNFEKSIISNEINKNEENKTIIESAINKEDNKTLIHTIQDSNTFLNNIIINSTYSTIINVSTINNLNNTILESFNYSFINIINKTIFDTNINKNINTIINGFINSDIINITNVSTIPSNKIIIVSSMPYINNTIEILKDFILTSNIKLSTIANNEFKTNNAFSDNTSLTDIIEKNENANIINKKNITDIINVENKDNIINDFPSDTNANIKINMDNSEKDKSFMNNIFRIFKSFLKNKLIYFLFALLGVIFCFIVLVLILCSIISCIKMFKRRNYMEQVDDIPRDSKYNTASLSSRSN